MCGNNILFSAALALVLATAAPVSAVDNLGAHFRDPAEFRQVIDQRCIGCHTAERIEAAMQRQEAIEPLTRRMLERGAVLSEREKEVLGTFWGSPMKAKEPKE